MQPEAPTMPETDFDVQAFARDIHKLLVERSRLRGELGLGTAVAGSPGADNPAGAAVPVS